MKTRPTKIEIPFTSDEKPFSLSGMIAHLRPFTISIAECTYDKDFDYKNS